MSIALARAVEEALVPLWHLDGGHGDWGAAFVDNRSVKVVCGLAVKREQVMLHEDSFVALEGRACGTCMAEARDRLYRASMGDAAVSL